MKAVTVFVLLTAVTPTCRTTLPGAWKTHNKHVLNELIKELLWIRHVISLVFQSVKWGGWIRKSLTYAHVLTFSDFFFLVSQASLSIIVLLTKNMLPFSLLNIFLKRHHLKYLDTNLWLGNRSVFLLFLWSHWHPTPQLQTVTSVAWSGWRDKSFLQCHKENSGVG